MKRYILRTNGGFSVLDPDTKFIYINAKSKKSARKKAAKISNDKMWKDKNFIRCLRIK